MFLLKQLDFVGLSNEKGRDNNLVPDAVSPTQVHNEMLLKISSPGKNAMVYTDSDTSGRIYDCPINILYKNKLANIRGCSSTSPIADEAQTPLANLTNNSCSKDWRLSSEDRKESVKQKRKFKRLRKVGDHRTSKNLESIKAAAPDPSMEISRSFSSPSAIRNKHQRGILNNIYILILSLFQHLGLFLIISLLIQPLFPYQRSMRCNLAKFCGFAVFYHQALLIIDLYTTNICCFQVEGNEIKMQ